MILSDSKIDNVTAAIARAVESNRFNFKKYSNLNYFRGVLCLVKEINDNAKEIHICGEHGKVVHRVVYTKVHTYIDGIECHVAFRMDKEERKQKREAYIEPLIEKIEGRMTAFLKEIISPSNVGTLNLLEFCASPHHTDINDEYYKNVGHLVKLLTAKLKQYAVNCDESKVEVLKEICTKIDSGLI